MHAPTPYKRVDSPWVLFLNKYYYVQYLYYIASVIITAQKIKTHSKRSLLGHPCNVVRKNFI